MNKPREKILLFVEYYLPGYKFGGPIQSVANLAQLLSETYEVYIVTRDRDFGDLQPYDGILTNEWIKCEYYQVIYLSPAHISIAAIHGLIQSQSFDYIYTNSLFSYFTRILLFVTLWSRQKIIIAPRGELNEGAINLKAYKKKPYIYLMRFVLNGRIIWHATDFEEIKSIKRIFFNSKIDPLQVRLAPDTPRLLSQRKSYYKETGRVRLVYVSRITPVKNLIFLLQLLKGVRQGSIEIYLYGPIADSSYWRQCKEFISELPINCQIVYKGALPHDKVNEVMALYDFMILPTLGENFGHTIFESLSVGLPVIISDKTPWRNLIAKNVGWDIPLKPSCWLDVLKICLDMDNQTYSQMSEQAKALANDYVKSEKFEQSYLKLFS
ncbi:glycosyltransferase [Spirosoma taeanense]|uniref:Glycosyltransferase n=1 Tax=Spirosoma taeanense TaxID=2735870 RepID=A0A6M5YD38_9BACT|nr:glycosyltransferase [Spirosoma taeanense]QJW91171.1 glycosyltransferase [Spirosoma taeanense]